MSNPLHPDHVGPILRRAKTRLQHPANYGRHTLLVVVIQSLRGDARLSVISGTFQVDLIRVRRAQAVHVLAPSDRLDVRVQAALDVIAPEIDDLYALVPDLTPGVWTIA